MREEGKSQGKTCAQGAGKREIYGEGLHEGGKRSLSEAVRDGADS